MAQMIPAIDDPAPCRCGGCDGCTAQRSAADVEALVGAHRGRLLALARRRGLPAEEAFDCVHEAFAAYLAEPGSRGSRDPEESARRLSALVLNGVRNRHRRKATARRRRADDAIEAVRADNPLADELLSRAEATERLRYCVTTLGEAQRAVITLRMLDGIAGEGVASALGLSPQNVAVLLHRAKAALRGCMAAAGHGASD